MGAAIRIISPQMALTSRWSGGSTTQWAIYPAEADYARRDFAWRISTAVMEDSYSRFTRLEGITRHLMLLRGNVLLLHPDRKAELAPYDVHSFTGEEPTECFGCGSDFNLMLTHGCTGSLEALCADRALTLPLDAKGRAFYGLYAFSGGAEISLGAEKHSLDEGCLLLCEFDGAAAKQALTVTPCAGSPARLVLARIYLEELE